MNNSALMIEGAMPKLLAKMAKKSALARMTLVLAHTMAMYETSP